MKEGIKTSEFWLNLLSQATIIVSGLQGQIDAQWVVIASAVLTGIYSGFRSYVKASEEKK